MSPPAKEIESMDMTGSLCLHAIRASLLLTWFICCGLMARADYPHVVLEDQPIGYWRMNEAQTATALNSGTFGAALNGTYVGEKGAAPGPTELSDGRPVLGLGPSNSAFDIGGGTDTYVAVAASPLNGLSAFTMTGWFSLRELEEERVGLFGQNDAIEFGFIQPDQLQLWTQLGGQLTWDFNLGSDLRLGDWYHVAAVGTGAGLLLYVNGENVQTGGTPITSHYGASDAPFRMGGGGIFDPAGNQFRGMIDEVAIWDVALTGEQIARQVAAALLQGIRGDFNGNEVFDVDDVNLLLRAIYDQSEDLLFDVDENGVIDDNDLIFWLQDIVFTWPGDSNLDGQFNSSDLVQVLAAGQYDDQIALNSTWDTGDWNGDLEFDSSDLVYVFGFGGYEAGPLAAVPVPEPMTGAWCAAVGALALLRPRWRRHVGG
jgi:hypothetical protein